MMYTVTTIGNNTALQRVQGLLGGLCPGTHAGKDWRNTGQGREASPATQKAPRGPAVCHGADGLHV